VVLPSYLKQYLFLSQKVKIEEILPKAGLVYSEKANLSEVLCKPKIMPIKSMTLSKIEEMQKAAVKQERKDDDEKE